MYIRAEVLSTISKRNNGLPLFPRMAGKGGKGEGGGWEWSYIPTLRGRSNKAHQRRNLQIGLLSWQIAPKPAVTLPDENAVSFNLQTMRRALKQRKRAIELLGARELFKSVEWLVEAEQPSLSARGFGNKGGGFTFKFSTRPRTLPVLLPPSPLPPSSSLPSFGK